MKLKTLKPFHARSPSLTLVLDSAQTFLIAKSLNFLRFCNKHRRASTKHLHYLFVYYSTPIFLLFHLSCCRFPLKPNWEAIFLIFVESTALLALPTGELVTLGFRETQSVTMPCWWTRTRTRWQLLPIFFDEEAMGDSNEENKRGTRLAKMVPSATLTQDPGRLVQLNLHHPLLLKAGQMHYRLPENLESYNLKPEIHRSNRIKNEAETEPVLSHYLLKLQSKTAQLSFQRHWRMLRMLRRDVLRLTSGKDTGDLYYQTITGLKHALSITQSSLQHDQQKQKSDPIEDSHVISDGKSNLLEGDAEFQSNDDEDDEGDSEELSFSESEAGDPLDQKAARKEARKENKKKIIIVHCPFEYHCPIVIFFLKRLIRLANYKKIIF